MKLRSRGMEKGFRAGAILLFAMGCGGNEIGLIPVEGTVTLDGRPLADADVIFRPEFGRPSLGRTDAEGRYRLRYTPDEPGAVPGVHHVSVSTYIEQDRDSSDPIVRVGRPETVPPEYNRRTTLHVELQAEQSDPIDFALLSSPPGRPPHDSRR